jgi:transglutaminase-like putative cysteine protease
MKRHISLAPAEGWLTLALVLVMCLALAWAIDDARPVINKTEVTDFLPWTVVGGVLCGFVGSKVGWGRWTTYLVGALAAAVITPILVGTVLLPDGGSISEYFRATANASVQAYIELVVEDQLLTREYGHHLLVLGLVMWGSSMFASYAAFGHRRPINAVLLIGVLLVANMSFTFQDQLPYLVLYSLASLFLLIRFHAFDEQTEWLRRRIGDPAAISGLYLRGGTVFIGVAVVGSLLLTNVASSDPLAGVWTDAGARVLEWARGIERFLPSSGTGVSFGPSFGPTARISGVWTTNNQPHMTIQLAPTEQDEDIPYWAAAVYDVFENQGWVQSATTPIDREPNSALLTDTGDQVSADDRRPLSIVVTPAHSTSIIYAPRSPETVDARVSVELVGGAGYLASIRRGVSDASYTVTALLPVLGETSEGSLTRNRLRAAGTDYPAEIRALYTQLPDGALGPDATALLEEIEFEAGPTAYDKASFVESLLRNPSRFTYSTDVRGYDCSQISVVECFARFKHGYCEYYASTMAVLLRKMGIPTRLVEGFLQGERDATGSLLQVSNDDAHAWVEVYFPKYGWVAFDPTGGGRANIPQLPNGAFVPIPSAGPAASVPTQTRRPDPEEGQSFTPGQFLPGQGTAAGAAGPLIVAALLLAATVGILAFLAWQRGPRGPVTADGVYGSITRLAARFGFGPRPDQTVYEYAGALAEVIPIARPDLETVAQAKVEVAYGGRVLGEDRLQALRAAQRSLRMRLLRLAVRRGRRGRRGIRGLR